MFGFDLFSFCLGAVAGGTCVKCVPWATAYLKSTWMYKAAVALWERLKPKA